MRDRGRDTSYDALKMHRRQRRQGSGVLSDIALRVTDIQHAAAQTPNQIDVFLMHRPAEAKRLSGMMSSKVAVHPCLGSPTRIPRIAWKDGKRPSGFGAKSTLVDNGDTERRPFPAAVR